MKDHTTGPVYATLDYTPAGGLKTVTMPKITETLAWNDRGELYGLSAATTAGANLLALGMYPCAGTVSACASGNTGSIQTQTVTAPGLSILTQANGYDTVNRLLTAAETAAATGVWNQVYDYTATGNRFVTTSVGYTRDNFTPTVSTNFNAKNQTQLMAAHDAAGNQTTEGGYTSTFDAEGRMIKNSINTSDTYYVYDGEGQRVLNQNALGTTIYVYDAGGDLAAEYTTAAAGETLPVGATNSCGTATCYLTVDHLGSTRMVTDSNGNVMRRYDYLPSGEEIPAGMGGRTAAMKYLGLQDGFNPKFTGQMRDVESGLDYFNARYYSPAQGRFVSPDPGNAGADPANPQTWNGYAYAGNNPTSITDPSGKSFGDFLGGLIHSFLNSASFGLWGAFTSILQGETPSVGGFGGLPGIGGLTGCGGAFGNCGSLGSGPWSEQTGLGNVQDPGRFVSDFNSVDHYNMTRAAGGSADFAFGVVGVDFWSGSQGIDGFHTHWHSMGGTTMGKSLRSWRTNIVQETCGQAYEGTVRQLSDATRKAAGGDTSAAKFAVHTIEDSYTAGPRYSSWPGGNPSWAYEKGDWAWSQAAVDGTRRYMQALRGDIALQNSESYLYPRPKSCK